VVSQKSASRVLMHFRLHWAFGKTNLSKGLYTSHLTRYL